MTAETTLNPISEAVAPLRQQLLEHAVYRRLKAPEDLRLFMEYHVFAVWDFMSLLKGLQRRLTCVEVPWLPQGDPAVRALINEIVLGEESDRGADGKVCSHFELYLQAMQEAGASTTKARQFLSFVREGCTVSDALRQAGAPEPARVFVEATFDLIATGKDHTLASAFTYGREDLIPSMFGELVERLVQEFPDRFTTLRYYLDRHIQLDGEEHGALGRQMVANLCGENLQRWNEAREAAVHALEERIRLWDGIERALASANGSRQE
jgi:Protein of unknown function (DUF3050)